MNVSVVWTQSWFVSVIAYEGVLVAMGHVKHLHLQDMLRFSWTAFIFSLGFACPSVPANTTMRPSIFLLDIYLWLCFDVPCFPFSYFGVK